MIGSDVTKTLHVETEAKTVASETEVEAEAVYTVYLETEAKAQGSWSVFLADPSVLMAELLLQCCVRLSVCDVMYCGYKWCVLEQKLLVQK